MEGLTAVDIEVVSEPELTAEEMEAWRLADSRALAVEDKGKPEDSLLANSLLADSRAQAQAQVRRDTAVVADRE